MGKSIEKRQSRMQFLISKKITSAIISISEKIYYFFYSSLRKFPMPPFLIMDKLNGSIENELLGICCRYSIADHLKDSKKTLDELSRDTGINPAALKRIMKIIIGFGFFKMKKKQWYANNFHSKFLLDDSPLSFKDLVLFRSSLFYRETIVQRLDHVLQQKESDNSSEGLKDIFSEIDTEKDEMFNNAMKSYSELISDMLITKYNFKDTQTICDLGGGTGHTLTKILSQDAKLKGIIFDIANAQEKAEENIEKQGLTDRCRFLEGDFFTTVPEKQDIYILQNILHDWSDDDVYAILQNTKSSMHTNSRILIIGVIMDATNDYSLHNYIDMEMLAIGGRERTLDEYQSILSGLNLRITRKICIFGKIYLLEIQSEK